MCVSGLPLPRRSFRRLTATHMFSFIVPFTGKLSLPGTSQATGAHLRTLSPSACPSSP